MHEEQVGEWVTVRRDEMELSIRDFAALLGVDAKTVGNVEAGRTAVRVGTRARWEDALGWKRGSLTAAYKRGEKPEPVEPSVDDESLEDFVRRVVPAARQEAALTMLRALIDEDPPTTGDRKIG